MGIAETYFSTEYWKSSISSESVHLKEELGRENSQDLSCTDQKTLADTVLCNEKKTVAGNSLPQKDPALNSNESHIVNSAQTNLSVMDASSALCYDVPDSHSTPDMQDSDISYLINEVSLTNDSDAWSSVSALIGQGDVTDDQMNLAGVLNSSGIGTKKITVKPVHSPQTLPKYPDTTFAYQAPSMTPTIYSAPETTMISTPMTTECSLYSIIHEASLSPTSNHEFTSKTVCQDTKHCAEDICALLSCISSASTRKANPKRKCGTNWESLSNSCNNSDLENTIVVPLACINSTGSSLMEADGTLQDLLITAYEYKREDMSHLASPLKLKHNQDTQQYSERMCGNLKSKDFHSANLVKESKYSSEKNQCLPYSEHQGMAHLYNNYSQISDAQNDLLNISQRAKIVSFPMPKTVLPYTSPTTQTQPSPCKSKSLGDLTSEDISCNFESKYKYISRGFITSGMRDKMVAALKAKKPQGTDSLTEQLRKLVSFDQEDGCPPFCSKQNDDCPKMLVRKLSSRSQSRVRNIASRAKERQEANKQKLSNAVSNVTGVVLRNKPSASPHVINRHSTGSYIASYLDAFSSDDLEGRGVPEGACTTLRNGYNDRFYTDDSLLETKSSEDDKPEIYFLLRL